MIFYMYLFLIKGDGGVVGDVGKPGPKGPKGTKIYRFKLIIINLL